MLKCSWPWVSDIHRTCTQNYFSCDFNWFLVWNWMLCASVSLYMTRNLIRSFLLHFDTRGWSPYWISITGDSSVLVPSYKNCLRLNHTINLLLCVFQELAQGLTRSAEAVCPRVVQRWRVCESLSECVSKKVRQTHTFLRSTLLEQTGPVISNRLR